MLLTLAKNHSSYSILENGISLFHYSYSNNSNSHHQHYLESSSSSLTDSGYLQNQGSNLDTIIETETKATSKITIYQKDTCCR